ncbi:MAG: hypothetical protein ACRDQA_01860 [Nocardioidaceae bacterium]
MDVVDASRKMAGDAVQIVGGNLAAATLLDIPAFGDARVALQTDEAEPVVAGLCATFDLHVETVESPVESFAVTGSTDLPIADSGREWDGDAAADAIFAWAREDGGDLNVSKASRGFFFHAGDGQNEGDYKLPFATVTDGELTIVPRGVYAVASVLEGGRGGVDIPEAAQRDIRGKVRTIYRRMDQTVPWDTDSSESSSAESVESFEVLGATDLPIADRDKEWDAAQAVDHMFAAATDDEGNLDLERLQQGFFYRNPDRGADAEWAYKLPFADVFGSTLTIVPNAVFAAAAVVQGARAPVDIPADQIEGIKSKIARIYERMDRVAPWLRTESDEEAGMCPECQQRRDTLMETARNELVERLDARVEAAGV